MLFIKVCKKLFKSNSICRYLLKFIIFYRQSKSIIIIMQHFRNIKNFKVKFTFIARLSLTFTQLLLFNS